MSRDAGCKEKKDIDCCFDWESDWHIGDISLAVVRHSHDLTTSNHAGYSGEDEKWYLDYHSQLQMGKCWKRPHAENSCFASVESFYALVGF